MTSLIKIAPRSFLSSDIVSTSSKSKRRIVVHGSVARYGPQSASASGNSAQQ